MRRAVIYARYSTEHQSEKSTEDQIVLCRQYADKEGFKLVQAYEDRARSGGSMHGREGLAQMMRDASDMKFDVVIVEALDRLSRDMEDLAGIHKRFTFMGIELRAVHEGVANTILVGLRGIVGQLYREDNVHKVKRGMAGLIREGKSAGGHCYGYRPDSANKGQRLIVEDEADIVRYIFAEFVAGKSPRSIAHNLNERGVAAPRGSKWNASTINGSSNRGYGILRNRLYIGEQEWARVHMIKDPSTGKRLSRPNPADQVQRSQVPHLQIVPTELFEAAQKRKADRSHVHPSHQLRPKRLLSGLVKCGACGSGLTSNGKDRSGRVRLRCSAHSESNSCPNPRTHYADTIEQRVLDRLGAALGNPEYLEKFVDTYLKRRAENLREAVKARSGWEAKLEKAVAGINRVVALIGEGHLTGSEAQPQLTHLRAQRDEAETALRNQPEVAENISLHPMAVRKYQEHIANLSATVGQTVQAGGEKELEALRELITRVTVYPAEDKDGEIAIQIEGQFNALVGWEVKSPRCVGVSGSGGGTRTPDTRIMIPLL